MGALTYDFGGWATKNDLLCSDGRTIKKDAFKHMDGQIVPLVYNHEHNEIGKVLGHALLENREEGVYAYCSLNDTEAGQDAKALVKHGDITSLSIYANQLSQQGSNVLHGDIREVSLVLAGANPGAKIDSVMIHGLYSDEEARIHTGESLELFHADEEPEKKEEKKEEKEPAMEEKKEEKSGKTIGEVLATLNKEQEDAVYAVIGMALAEDPKQNDKKESKNEDSEGGEKEMKHNVFENDSQNQDAVLMHDAMNSIIKDAKRFGTMKESFLSHADEYGIQNIDWLLPEAKTTTNVPEFIQNQPTDWTGVVMAGIHRTPFSRIKTVFADITDDEARAKGYIKGKYKKEEVFTLLKRTTTPTTIYKKQKMDRDDVIDITDFDAVSWIKQEMRIKLDEEIARAIVFGDGRLSSSDDKINESNVRPIISDEDLFTIKKTVTPATGESVSHAIINAIVEAQDEYQGSGNLTAFMESATVTAMLLMEDKDGHRMYKTIQELANAMNVNKIVKVAKGYIPAGNYGVVVDLKDYDLGADKGGAINMFDDFDIDYNQMKYLIETRCSGALVKPFSAIALKKPAVSNS